MLRHEKTAGLLAPLFFGVTDRQSITDVSKNWVDGKARARDERS